MSLLRSFVLVRWLLFLKVIDVNRVGAFLDWGLDKDLLVPKSEQYRPMEKDKFYIIYVNINTIVSKYLGIYAIVLRILRKFIKN